MKLNKYTLLISFLFLTLLSLAHAATPSETLSQLLKKMHTMQANFTQTILDKKGRAVQTSTGKMALQRPSQFRWEVLRPNRQLIVTNGKRLWVYDPDLEQVTVRSLVKAAGQTPAMLLSDEDLSVGHEFDVATTAANDSLQWYLLKPKDKNSMIANLKLGFANQVIQKMQLEDHLGHKTMITFTNVKFNSPSSPSLFVFTPPAHVDVIDETQH